MKVGVKSTDRCLSIEMLCTHYLSAITPWKYFQSQNVTDFTTEVTANIVAFFPVSREYLENGEGFLNFNIPEIQSVQVFLSKILNKSCI